MPTEVTNGARRRRTKADARRRHLARERARVLEAAESVIAERGAHEATVEAVSVLAGVPFPAVDALFEDDADMLLAVFVELTARIGAQMGTAAAGGATWVERVRAGVAWLLDYLDSEPRLARFLLVESFAVERIHRSRAAVIASAAQALQAGAPPMASPGCGTPFGSEAVVATVASVLHGRMLEQPVPRLSLMAGSVMALIVLPFLGTSASREELARSSR